MARMLKEIADLLVLQDRDRKIRALKNELKTAPLELKQLDEKLAVSQSTFETSRGKAREVEVERQRLEMEVRAKRDQIAKYQGQKFQTRKNEEFQALSTAIEHLEQDIQKLEDRELELMENAEVLRPQIVEADQSAQQMKSLVARQQVDLGEKVKTVQQQIITLEAERAELASKVNEDLLEIYERLFTSKGEAVVALEHEVCTGCHMKVTASTAARTRAGREVVQCEQCNRLLYFEEY
jgi:predicted  nucleic acid-binding Zn-ribbon protein